MLLAIAAASRLRASCPGGVSWAGARQRTHGKGRGILPCRGPGRLDGLPSLANCCRCSCNPLPFLHVLSQFRSPCSASLCFPPMFARSIGKWAHGAPLKRMGTDPQRNVGALPNRPQKPNAPQPRHPSRGPYSPGITPTRPTHRTFGAPSPPPAVPPHRPLLIANSCPYQWQPHNERALQAHFYPPRVPTAGTTPRPSPPALSQTSTVPFRFMACALMRQQDAGGDTWRSNTAPPGPTDATPNLSAYK